ncbi:glycosyltransferase [Jatrophihabitans endophyticus]|uniref:glycosyltransferase n=1 Tax=Jatrophihabitans endophyticus TaxID=1206085 RepID=UPI0026F23923|nr:glycosyltransferase [Jatrophihabitans endophyticus]
MTENVQDDMAWVHVDGIEVDRAPRVVAVVVTYNRRPLLLECLAAIRSQTRRTDAVIVVDNASTDGTSDLVRADADLEAVVLTRNTGGAGGFAVGMTMALAEGADLLWLLDDDAVPEPDALEELLRARDGVRGAPPVLMASRVVWTDGRPHPMNTPRRRPFASRSARAAADVVGCIPIRSASFVSTLVDAAATRRMGLPRADYFLWNDDFEFTTRLLRNDVGLLCPASVVVHKTSKFGSTAADPGERFFYEVRNKIWTLTAPGTLHTAERVLYTGSTLRRWARTFVRSKDRATLLRAFVAGVKAALRNRPRPTSDVLAELGYRDAR